MGNPLYAVRETGLCPACHYDRDSVTHYRLHVPRDRWPASMRSGAPRVEHGPYERAAASTEYARRVAAEPFAVPFPAGEYDTDDKRVGFAVSSLPDANGVVDTYGVVEYGPNHPNSKLLAVSGEASAPGFRTFPDAADAEVPPSPEAAPTCVCGRVAASNAGLAAHQRHCEQFKAVTNGA